MHTNLFDCFSAAASAPASLGSFATIFHISLSPLFSLNKMKKREEADEWRATETCSGIDASACVRVHVLLGPSDSLTVCSSHSHRRCRRRSRTNCVNSDFFHFFSPRARCACVCVCASVRCTHSATIKFMYREEKRSAFFWREMKRLESGARGRGKGRRRSSAKYFSSPSKSNASMKTHNGNNQQTESESFSSFHFASQ